MTLPSSGTQKPAINTKTISHTCTHTVYSLPQMARRVPRVVIQMDTSASSSSLVNPSYAVVTHSSRRNSQSPLDSRQTLEGILQTLSEIVRVSQAEFIIQDDIDLDVELVARMICMHARDLSDTPRKAHSDVEEHVALVGGRGGSRKVLDVPFGYAHPRDHDVDGQEETAEGVQVPLAGETTEEREDDGEEVKYNCGRMSITDEWWR